MFRFTTISNERGKVKYVLLGICTYYKLRICKKVGKLYISSNQGPRNRWSFTCFTGIHRLTTEKFLASWIYERGSFSCFTGKKLLPRPLRSSNYNRILGFLGPQGLSGDMSPESFGLLFLAVCRNDVIFFSCLVVIFYDHNFSSSTLWVAL